MVFFLVLAVFWLCVVFDTLLYDASWKLNTLVLAWETGCPVRGSIEVYCVYVWAVFYRLFVSSKITIVIFAYTNTPAHHPTQFPLTLMIKLWTLSHLVSGLAQLFCMVSLPGRLVQWRQTPHGKTGDPVTLWSSQCEPCTVNFLVWPHVGHTGGTSVDRIIPAVWNKSVTKSHFELHSVTTHEVLRVTWCLCSPSQWPSPQATETGLAPQDHTVAALKMVSICVVDIQFVKRMVCDNEIPCQDALSMFIVNKSVTFVNPPVCWCKNLRSQ